MTEISQDQDHTVQTNAAGERLTVDRGVSIKPSGHGHVALVAAYAENVLINYGSVVGDKYGVVLSGDGDRLVNKTDGYIHGTNAGVFVQDAADAVITNRGHIDSGDLGSGIEMKGGLTLDNQGVVGGFCGLLQTRGSSGDVAVTNSGLIQGAYAMAVNEGSDLLVNNTGTIHGDYGSIVGSFGKLHDLTIINSGEIDGAIDPAVGALTITNSGVMNGSFNAYPSDGVVSITNTGQINSDLTLSTSADIYDGGGGHLSGFLDGLAGNDTLIGGSDADMIIGGQGADRLDGGAGGGDTFVYDRAHESTAAVGDVIQANWSDTDVFDLTRIDADKTTAGRQHAGFAGEIVAGDPSPLGQVAYYHQDGDTFVVLDHGGGAKSMMVIQIAGEVTLTADNFVV